MNSPLLHGKITKTPLDLVTDRLYGLFPLNNKQIEYLNTIIYKDKFFWINYWSFTHFFLAFFAAYLNITSMKTYVILHITFELWELWSGGYITEINGTKHNIDIQEITDTLLDILIATIGFYLGESIQ